MYECLRSLMRIWVVPCKKAFIKVKNFFFNFKFGILFDIEFRLSIMGVKIVENYFYIVLWFYFKDYSMYVDSLESQNLWNVFIDYGNLL